MSWIKVKDKMPEYNQNVLVSHGKPAYQGVSVGYFCEEDKVWYLDDLCTDLLIPIERENQGGGPPYKVHGWMPLPDAMSYEEVTGK